MLLDIESFCRWAGYDPDGLVSDLQDETWRPGPADLIPSAVVETWPGLGHWLHRVEPERFLSRVRELHRTTGGE